MIGALRYFCNRYFAPRYWPKIGDTIVLSPDGRIIYIRGSVEKNIAIKGSVSPSIYLRGSVQPTIYLKGSL